MGYCPTCPALGHIERQGRLLGRMCLQMDIFYTNRPKLDIVGACCPNESILGLRTSLWCHHLYDARPLETSDPNKIWQNIVLRNELKLWRNTALHVHRNVTYYSIETKNGVLPFPSIVAQTGWCRVRGSKCHCLFWERRHYYNQWVAKFHRLGYKKWTLQYLV